MKKEWTKAELFYLEANKDKSDAELAADLGTTTARVAGWRKPKKSKGPRKTFFAEDRGTVSMTAAQSKDDDDNPTSGQNQAFWEAMKKNVHIIDPTKPVR